MNQPTATHQVEIAIQRIYTKDMSFESPLAPKVFTQNVNPQISLDLNTSSNKLDEHQYEVSLTLTATAKNSSEVIFIAEAEMAGIFTIKGAQDQALKRILAAYCPNILFPYIREAIDAMTTRGSFPPLMLAPINFEALFEQKKTEAPSS